eukprot:TRINITY_DN9033_c0_g2_i2.p1 TRINITY_DN9033_c0_g2~~TRINITY_DN9033_c0_g2_i2.p1  ORF type:complete len:211 (-),score=42.44 TRINITY_DN9033_c0_g2_i2:82-714(-)
MMPLICALLFENKEVRPHSMKRKEMRQALEATLEVGNYEARLQQVRDLGPEVVDALANASEERLIELWLHPGLAAKLEAARHGANGVRHVRSIQGCVTDPAVQRLASTLKVRISGDDEAYPRYCHVDATFGDKQQYEFSCNMDEGNIDTDLTTPSGSYRMVPKRGGGHQFDNPAAVLAACGLEPSSAEAFDKFLVMLAENEYGTCTLSNC